MNQHLLRFRLFNANQTLTHIKNADSADTPNKDWKTKLSYYSELNKKINDKSVNQCNSELHIEPLSWFQEKLSDINGKVACFTILLIFISCL